MRCLADAKYEPVHIGLEIGHMLQVLTDAERRDDAVYLSVPRGSARPNRRSLAY